MKYGICQWNLPVAGPAGCEVLKKLGLDGMELSYEDTLLDEVPAYLCAKEKYGVEFPTLGMNVFCGTSYTKEGSEETFEAIVKKALECAKLLGAKTLQFPTFFASEVDSEETLAMAAKNMRRACELAEGTGVKIGSENALNLEWNKRLFEMVDRPELTFYFDNQNLKRMKGLECKDVFLGMRDKLVEVHAKDSLKKEGEKRAMWMPLGEGECEFASSMVLMKETAYDGWIHLENDYQVGRPNNPDFSYEEAIRHDLGILKGIFE